MALLRAKGGSSVRAFVAVDIGPDIRAELRPVVAELRKLNAAVRWVTEDNWHLTVKFLGNLEWRQLGDLSLAVQQAAATVPVFEMTLAGLHAFPPGPNPRIVAVDVTAGVEGLRALHQAFDRRMQDLGVPAENRSFLAHLTLGRVQGTQGAERLWEALKKQAGREFGSVEVTEVVLFQSELRPAGAQYTPLAHAKLGPPAAGA
jgi:2'-5' RNA ligase